MKLFLWRHFLGLLSQLPSLKCKSEQETHLGSLVIDPAPHVTSSESQTKDLPSKTRAARGLVCTGRTVTWSHRLKKPATVYRRKDSEDRARQGRGTFKGRVGLKETSIYFHNCAQDQPFPGQFPDLRHGLQCPCSIRASLVACIRT